MCNCSPACGSRGVLHLLGGTNFFTVTLLGRRGNDLLMRQVDALRETVPGADPQVFGEWLGIATGTAWGRGIGGIALLSSPRRAWCLPRRLGCFMRLSACMMLHN